jgi:hypothetical protein
LGSDAWAQRAVVTWRLAGDDADVEHQIWLTFLSDGGQLRLAGTVDEPPSRIAEQKPSWWLGPLTVSEREGVTVIAGSGQPLERWANLAAAALDNVRDNLPDGLRLSWSGHIVMEVPATPRDFESILGERPGSYGSIAAVTRRAGAADGATRIVVNPKAAQLGSSALQAMLEHEMVHVATSSPDSPAPVWAEEGLAEWVSTKAHAGQPSEATDDVLTRVRRVHFLPTRNSRSASVISEWPTPRPGLFFATLPTGTPRSSSAASTPSSMMDTPWTRRASQRSTSVRRN